MAKTTESTQEQEQVQLEDTTVDTTPENTPEADNAAGDGSTSEDGNQPEADNAPAADGEQFPVILSDPDLDALLNQVAEFRASHSEIDLITGAIAHDDSTQLFYIRIDKRQNYANS